MGSGSGSYVFIATVMVVALGASLLSAAAAADWAWVQVDQQMLMATTSTSPSPASRSPSSPPSAAASSAALVSSVAPTPGTTPPSRYVFGGGGGGGGGGTVIATSLPPPPSPASPYAGATAGTPTVTPSPQPSSPPVAISWAGFPSIRRPDAGTATTRPTVVAAVPFAVPAWVTGTCTQLVVDYTYLVVTTNTSLALSWQPGAATFYVWAPTAAGTLTAATFGYAALIAVDTWQAPVPILVEHPSTLASSSAVAFFPRARYERANLTASPALYGPGGRFFLGMFFQQPGYGGGGTAGGLANAGLCATYDAARQAFSYVDAYANFLADPLLSATQVMFTAAPTHTDYYTYDADPNTTQTGGLVNRLLVRAALYCPVNLTAVAANANATLATSATKPLFFSPLPSPPPPSLLPSSPPSPSSSSSSSAASVLATTLTTASAPLWPSSSSSSGNAAYNVSMSGNNTNTTPAATPDAPDVTTTMPVVEIVAEDALIVIGVAAAFAVLVLVVLGGYYYWRRRRQHQRRIKDLMRDPAGSAPDGSGNGADAADAAMIPLEDHATGAAGGRGLNPIAPFTDANEPVPDEEEHSQGSDDEDDEDGGGPSKAKS